MEHKHAGQPVSFSFKIAFKKCPYRRDKVKPVTGCRFSKHSLLFSIVRNLIMLTVFRM